MNIPDTFISYAAEILGDTKTGLPGSEIAKYLSEYATDLDIEIPYPSSPFPENLPNKRTALLKNLLAFPGGYRYEIIKRLCELEFFSNNEKVKDLKIKLVSRYSDTNNYTIDPEVNSELVESTSEWLKDYPDSKRLYEDAISKLENNIFERNLLDDLRLSLEKVVNDLVGNKKTLENQLSEIGNLLKSKKISTEIVNMLVKLIDYFTKYQNTYIKHNDKVNEKEIDFIFELTSSVMKFLIRVKKI